MKRIPMLLLAVLLLIPILALADATTYLNGPREQPRIAVTVDDCFDMRRMEEILVLAEEYDAKITFFAVGAAVKHKDKALWVELLRKGHELGNHTMEHPELQNITGDKVISNMHRMENRVNDVLGFSYPMSIMRPPYRMYNGRTLTHLETAGYPHVIIWDVNTTLSSEVIKKTQNGSILLFHAKEDDVECLRVAMPILKEMGFEMVTVSELLGFDRPPVEAADLYPARQQALAVTQTPGEDIPLYTAVTTREVSLYQEGKKGAKRIDKTEKGITVQVYEYGDEWCLIGAGELRGYCATSQLTTFSVLQPFLASMPGHVAPAGMVALPEEMTLSGKRSIPAGAEVAVFLAEENREDIVPLLSLESKKVALEVGTKAIAPFAAWETAEPGALLSGYTVVAPVASTKKHEAWIKENQALNIALATSRLDGTIVSPGQSLSFNEICGPYAEKAGYLLAPGQGHALQTPGGAVSQLSSALYNALLGLPVFIEERNERLPVRETPYVAEGAEAVVGTVFDLAFYNTLPYALEVRCYAWTDATTVIIYRAIE